jgi:hypothetical protein
MPVYRCRFLNHAGSMVQTRLVAENEPEATETARSISAISGARWFELFQGERLVCVERESEKVSAGDVPKQPDVR